VTRCGSAADYPCFCNPDLPNQVECPYCGFSSQSGALFCARNQETIVFPDGSIDLESFQNGDSFGDLVEGRCGPSTAWPSFCNVEENSTEFLIDYPYCVFEDTNSAEVLCARNLEDVTYTNKDGDQVTCNCSYTQAGGPQPNCKTRPNPDSTPSPTFPPRGVPEPPSPAPQPASSSYSRPPTLGLFFLIGSAAIL